MPERTTTMDTKLEKVATGIAIFFAIFLTLDLAIDLFTLLTRNIH